MSPEKKSVNLKTLAAKVGLAPCSVSAILNDTEAAAAIPQTTKDRVYRAAAEFNYRPNFMARSLRTRRTRMIAVIAPGLARPDVAHVVVAAQQRLQRHGYMVVLATSDLENTYHLCAQFQQRGIEGVIAVEAAIAPELNMPVTVVDLDAPVVHQLQGSLSELGDSAADAVVRQIEQPGSRQRLTIEYRPPLVPALHRMSIESISAVETA